MKLFKIVLSVNKHGRITLQSGVHDATELKTGGEMNVTLAVDDEVAENTCPQLVLTTNVSEADGLQLVFLLI